CAFVQGVVDPQMCGLGGCGVMLFRSGSTDSTTVLEFYARAGSRVRPDQWEALYEGETADHFGYLVEGRLNDAGYGSVGVPGTVAGLAEAHARFGSLTWSRLLEPAIGVAREGFAVSGNLYNAWVAADSPGLVPMRERLVKTDESARIYTRAGELYQPGELLRCPDYASTLERLAREGAQDFYRGSIARRIAEDFDANGGTITLEDLAGYRVRAASPVRGSYRGLDLESAGPPAGGTTLLQMLNYLEGFDLGSLGWPSVEAARLRAEAMRWAFGDRDHLLADPEWTEVPVERMTDKEYAAAARGAHDAGTTHVCVVDGLGNAVSMTHTLGSSSGVVTPGLGFTYNNYLNCFDPRPGRIQSLAPGKTRVTMMTPTFGFRSGELALAAGAPGATRIVGGVLQTILNLVDHGMTPVEAVSAPRIDYNSDVLQAEHRLPAAVLSGLAGLGYRVERRPLSYDPYFSRVQVITRSASGEVEGASDPRKDGGVALSLD
ncbi:MAG: gamma-glutamyltransferase, partial [Candidatus Dormibacteraeota bacterium]|nr:gamma-glutamyltransferase [Candidatus Dormibacteraeota bacterium]